MTEDRKFILERIGDLDASGLTKLLTTIVAVKMLPHEKFQIFDDLIVNQRVPVFDAAKAVGLDASPDQLCNILEGGEDA